VENTGDRDSEENVVCVPLGTTTERSWSGSLLSELSGVNLDSSDDAGAGISTSRAHCAERAAADGGFYSFMKREIDSG